MLAGEWQNFKSVVLRAEAAGELMPKWQALAANALESSGFNAPELVLPILKQSRHTKLATVQQAANLHFAIPIIGRGIYNTTWRKPFNAAGTPHLSEGLKEAALMAFLAAQTKPFLFKSIPTDGPFHQQLKKQAARYRILDSWERACLRPEGSYEDWLQTNFDQKRRKEFKRQRNRLSEQGTLQTIALEKDAALDKFTQDFLTLEASGWKGKKGTAINTDANMAKALRESLAHLHAAGKLRFWSLMLNGKSIASLFAIVEGNQAWLGKIAYDENFAKFSPGALIILDCTQSFFAEPGIIQIDSSAIPNHPLIDRIWRDRLAMISVFVGPATLSSSRFIFIAAICKQKLKWRKKLRNIYYRVKGKAPS